MLELALPPRTRPVAGVHTSRRLALIAGVAGLTAAVVAMLGSWIPSLWGDEAATVTSARRSLGSLFMMLGHVDAVHGFYYLGMHFWVKLFGYSPFALRLPSAVAVGIAAAAVVWMCGRMRSTRLAVIAGAVAVVLPRLTYAGEEARAFAFDAAIAAVLCAIVAEIAIARVNRRRLWIAYAVLLVLGVYTFLYLGLMAVVAAVFLLLTPSLRNQLRSWAIATGLAAAASVPLVVLAYLERGQVAYLATHVQVSAFSLLTQMWFSTVWFAVVAWVFIAIAVVGTLVPVIQRRAAGRTAGGAARPDSVAARPDSVVTDARPDVVLLALCWLMLPMGILIAASTVISDFTARYGTLAAPAAAVLIAAGIETIARRGWQAIVAVAVVVAVAVPVWVSQRGPYSMNESDWNEIAATVQSNAIAGDGIVFDGEVRPTRRPRLAMTTDPAAFTAVKDVTVETPYARNDTWYDKAYSVEAAADLGRFHGVDRVWVVEYTTAGHTDAWGISSLRQLGFHQTTRYDLHTSVVYLFTR